MPPTLMGAWAGFLTWSFHRMRKCYARPSQGSCDCLIWTASRACGCIRDTMRRRGLLAWQLVLAATCMLVAAAIMNWCCTIGLVRIRTRGIRTLRTMYRSTMHGRRAWRPTFRQKVLRVRRSVIRTSCGFCRTSLASRACCSYLTVILCAALARATFQLCRSGLHLLHRAATSGVSCERTVDAGLSL